MKQLLAGFLTARRFPWAKLRVTDFSTKLFVRQLSGEHFKGHHGEGKVVGSKIGCLAANVAYGLDRAELKDEFRAEILRIMGMK